MNISNGRIGLLFAVLLVACEDAIVIPPQRAVGAVEGSVVFGNVSNAQVNVYGFGMSGFGEKLASTTTDNNGNYTIDLQTGGQPIVVEVRGGNYIEEASGVNVNIADDQTLLASAIYEPGSTLKVMVTPLTHIATGLARYKITGESSAISDAIEDARAEVDDFFSMNTIGIRPIEITDESRTVTALSQEALYGFYLAGLSNWTRWVSDENSVLPHTLYSSAAVIQVFYNDILADGMINGFGFDTNGTTLVSLALGVVPVDEDAFRSIFSLYMLDISKSGQNKTEISATDLSIAANSIAEQTNTLLGASAPLNLDAVVPELIVDQPSAGIYNGILSFQASVSGMLGAEVLTVYVDSDKDSEYINPVNPMIGIDTSAYSDGQHQITVNAINALGNLSSVSFDLQFDNTAPLVEVTSPSATNQSPAQIYGTYDDSVAGIQSLKVQDKNATLNQNGTWVSTIDLIPGVNVISIVCIDNMSNQYEFNVDMYLDTIVPVIDTTDKHSTARFSYSDGTYYEAVLQNNNNAAPLYFETNKIELNGINVTRQDLNDNLIPFFAFSVTDQLGPQEMSALEDLQVYVQYERNDQILSASHIISAVDQEFIIPLITEGLAPNWHQAIPSDQHVIYVEVKDVAGNTSSIDFSFSGHFFVPPFNIETITELGNGLFSDTIFADRASLSNIDFASTSYTFTNPASYSAYMSVTDDSVHIVDQTVEQLVREHFYVTEATTLWRIGLMVLDNPAQCPVFSEWNNITSVWNWNSVGWALKLVPELTVSDPSMTNSDDLPVPDDPSIWYDVTDFDDFFMDKTIDDSQYNLTYYYDYKLDVGSLSPPAALVQSWRAVDKTQEPPTELLCPIQRYFQQQQVYSNESVEGYPKPVLSFTTVTDLPVFNTTDFTVWDNDADLNIAPVDNLYRIPAGHSVTITKSVTTPVLNTYNDDVSNVESFPSYVPNWYDKKIEWTVDKNLNVEILHDAGVNNISAMLTRTVGVETGSTIYQIMR